MTLEEFFWGDALTYRGCSGTVFSARLVRERTVTRIEVTGVESGRILAANITNRVSARNFFNDCIKHQVTQ